MRVALVVERFLPRGGGVEHVAWQVAHGLAACGDRVHVIAREGAEPDPPTHPEGRVEIHRVRVPTFWQPVRVLAFSRASAAWLARSGHAVDVVHGFTRVRHQDLHRAGGGSHADHLLHTHGRWGARWRRLSPRHRVLLAAERAIYGDPRILVQCPSELVRAALVARFGLPAERLRVIPNGVDCALHRPGRWSREAAALRDSLGAGAHAVWLLAGSGARRKGWDTALAALARCGDREARLWIAGRDDPRPWQRLARRLGVAERVHFLGERRDMPAVHAASDALILPTRYDAFANVCLEAAASARPVLSSGTNGAMELLAEAGACVRDPGDVSGFAHAMDVLADAGRRRALGERAWKIAERHDWPAHVRRVRALYAGMGAGSAAGETADGTAAQPARQRSVSA